MEEKNQWFLVCLDVGLNYQLGSFPLRVGRAIDNEICVLSPFFSQHQFTLAKSETGELTLTNDSPPEEPPTCVNDSVIITSTKLSVDAVHVIRVEDTVLALGTDADSCVAELEKINREMNRTEQCFIVKGEVFSGPFKVSQLEAFAQAGTLSPETILAPRAAIAKRLRADELIDFPSKEQEEVFVKDMPWTPSPVLAPKPKPRFSIKKMPTPLFDEPSEPKTPHQGDSKNDLLGRLDPQRIIAEKEAESKRARNKAIVSNLTTLVVLLVLVFAGMIGWNLWQDKCERNRLAREEARIALEKEELELIKQRAREKEEQYRRNEERRIAQEKEQKEREAARERERKEREAVLERERKEREERLAEESRLEKQRELQEEIDSMFEGHNFDIADIVSYDDGVEELLEVRVKESKWERFKTAREDGTLPFLNELRENYRSTDSVYCETNCPNIEVIGEILKKLNEEEFTLLIQAKGGKLPEGIMLYLTLIDNPRSRDLPKGAKFIKGKKATVKGWSMPFKYGIDKPAFFIRLEREGEKVENRRNESFSENRLRTQEFSSNRRIVNISKVKIDAAFKWRDSGSSESIEGKIFPETPIRLRGSYYSYDYSHNFDDLTVVIERYDNMKTKIDRLEVVARAHTRKDKKVRRHGNFSTYETEIVLDYYLVSESIPGKEEAVSMKIIEIRQNGKSIPFKLGTMGRTLRKRR